MSIIPNRARPSVSSVLSVRDPSPYTRADIDLGWSDLLEPPNHLGCPSVVPEGETAERVVRESACRRGGSRDIEDRRRSLHRDVGTTSMIHVDHFHRRLTSNVPQSPSAAPPGD